MANSDLKLEIELRMYWIEPNLNKKWWQFWVPKEIRRLVSNQEFDEINQKD